MSYNIRNIREISTDPLTKFTNQLSKKIAKFQTDQQQGQLESKEDVYSNAQDIDTVLKLHSDLVGTKSFDFNTQYYSTFEPDNTYLTLWLRGINLGNTIRDTTAVEDTCSLFGDPTLVDGMPFDDGIFTGGTKSIALRFNRPTSELQNQEYVTVPHASNKAINGLTTGISFFIRFRIFDLSQQNGRDRTLYVKVDDTTTPSNGAFIRISDTGRVLFFIKRAGTEYNVQTATGTIATNTVYDLWCTYANSGNVQHIYVNNVDKTLTTPSSPTWPITTTEAQIMRREADNGYTYGDLYDFRLYREKVISSTEVGYLNTNKWSISNIPFGQVMVSNYWATYGTISSGYTTTGYTTVGYDT